MSEEDSSLRQAIDRAMDSVQARFAELGGESERAAAILAVASLEDALETAIRSRFARDMSPKLWKRIAGPGFTPLGSLKARADVAQAFGFYGPKTRNIIKTVASIRNKFAHSTDIRSFAHPEVMQHCLKMDRNHLFPEGRIDAHSPPDHVRWAYIHTIRALEKRLTVILRHVPELGDEQPEPLP